MNRNNSKKRYSTGMSKLGDFMPSALAKKGLRGAANSAMICFFAGEYPGDLFSPISFSRGILKVSVTSSGAAQAVQMAEEKILRYVNDRAGYECVKSVRIENHG